MEKPTNAEWHRQQQERLARLAAEMGRMFIPGHSEPQSAVFEATRAKYLWGQHEKAEHDKSVPPFYGDHRNC